MKTVKILLFVGMLFFFNSCSLTVDVDDDDSVGRITATATGDNSDGSVSDGGYLALTVTVADGDGIASIRIEIPALNIDFLTKSNTGLPNQKINQTFNVDEIDLAEPATIYVTLTDRDRNVYERTVPFSIK